MGLLLPGLSGRQVRLQGGSQSCRVRHDCIALGQEARRQRVAAVRQAVPPTAGCRSSHAMERDQSVPNGGHCPGQSRKLAAPVLPILSLSRPLQGGVRTSLPGGPAALYHESSWVSARTSLSSGTPPGAIQATRQYVSAVQ